MISLRFTERRQKDVQLTIARDLLLEHQDDQLARTVLSNAIIAFEGTMVSGELDAMIKRTNRMGLYGNIGVSVFLGLLALYQIWLGLTFSWANYMSALATVVYMGSTWGLWCINRRYQTTLKWLESLQFDMPSVPASLAVVKH